MIVSHKHKFIFIKTKKTAGTSIEIALTAICGDNDIITPINIEDEELRKEKVQRSFQNIDIPFSKYTLKDWLRFIKNKKKLTYYNHMPASKLKKYLDNNIWDSYYKFCFERDPISKCISHYKWRGQKKQFSSFESYLNSQDVLLIKGDKYYKNKKGDYLVDKIYKMEEMKEAFEDIAKKIKLRPNQLEAPNFKTKISDIIKTLNYDDVKESYSKQIKSIFKTAYQDLYSL